jgi:hypothetical protein
MVEEVHPSEPVALPCADAPSRADANDAPSRADANDAQ